MSGLDLSKVDNRLKELEQHVKALEQFLVDAGILRLYPASISMYSKPWENKCLDITPIETRSLVNSLIDKLGYEKVFIAGTVGHTEVVKKKPVRKR